MDEPAPMFSHAMNPSLKGISALPYFWRLYH